MQEMRAQFTDDEIEEIALVAKVMDAANRSSNTFDALLSRLSGKPSRSSTIVDEAIMSAAFCAFLPPLLVYFSRASKRSIGELLQRMIGYTRKMEAEYMAAEQGRKGPARARKQPSGKPKQAARRRKQAAQAPEQPEQVPERVAQAPEQPAAARKRPARARKQPAQTAEKPTTARKPARARKQPAQVRADAAL